MEIKIWEIILILFILGLFIIEFLIEINIPKFFLGGKAVQDTVSVEVTVVTAGDTQPPNLTLFEPKSINYINGYYLWIWYTTVDDSSNISSVWFNLNNGTNYTLPLPVGSNSTNGTFNASTGSHVFYIFANDTKNNVNDSINVNFTVVSNHQINETAVDSNGNLIFNNPTINKFVKNISGLDASWTVNFTLFNNETPSNWNNPSSNIGKKMFYFEIFVNTQDSTSGSFTLNFNLSHAQLSGVSPTDISGFFFNNGIWNELTTNTVNKGDPTEFSVVLTHLSRFLIGGKGSTSSSTSTASSGASSQGKTYVPKIPEAKEPSETPPKIPPEPEQPKEEEPKGKLPISKLRELQEPSVISIMAIFFILVSLLLIIIRIRSKYEKKGRKHVKKKSKKE